MNIIILSSNYPIKGKEYSGIRVRDLNIYLERYGFFVIIIVPYDFTPPTYIFKRNIILLIINLFKWLLKTINNYRKNLKLRNKNIIIIPWIHLPKRYFHKYEGKTLYYFIRRKINIILNSYNIDIIHSFFAIPEGVAISFFKKTKKVLTVMGSDINVYANKKSIVTTLKESFKNIDGVIYVSEALKNKAIKSGIDSSNSIVLPNLISVSNFFFMKRDGCNYKLLYLGNYIPIKRLDILIKAIHYLNDKNIILDCFGKGYLFESLNKIINYYHLLSRVRLYNSVSYERIPWLIQQYDALCLASDNEGTPNVIKESLLCGVPVISTDVGGVAELIPDFAGILVRPNDAREFSKAIEKFYKIKWNRVRIMNYAQNRFSLEKRGTEYISFYENIIIN